MSRFQPHISDEFIDIKDPPFRPFVLVLTERTTPSSVGMAAMAGAAIKYIDLWSDATPADLHHVKKLVQERFTRDQGQVPLFGKITGFFFVFSPTAGIMLDLDGNEVGRREGQFWPKSISMQNRI